MAKKSQGFTLRQRGNVWFVRFWHPKQGRQVEYSTGEQDFERAKERASQIYAQTIQGGFKPKRIAKGGPISFEKVSVQFIEAHRKIYSRDYIQGFAMVCDSHLSKEFPSLLDVYDTQRVKDYYLMRLGHVVRNTVKHEASILRVLVKWASAKGILKGGEPVIPTVPKQLGTTYKRRSRTKADELAPEEIERILAFLPEWDERYNGEQDQGKLVRFAIRARFIVQYDCALRPSILDRLKAPDHWCPGSTWLTLPAKITKSKRDTRKPLSPRAKAALESIYRGEGRLFGKHDYRPQLRKAAAKGILDPVRAGRFCGQHFRSAKITHFLDAGAPLTAAAFLADHRQISTTSIYARPSERALLAELERQANLAASLGHVP